MDVDDSIIFSSVKDGAQRVIEKLKNNRKRRLVLDPDEILRRRKAEAEEEEEEALLRLDQQAEGDAADHLKDEKPEAYIEKQPDAEQRPGRLTFRPELFQSLFTADSLSPSRYFQCTSKYYNMDPKSLQSLLRSGLVKPIPGSRDASALTLYCAYLISVTPDSALITAIFHNDYLCAANLRLSLKGLFKFFYNWGATSNTLLLENEFADPTNTSAVQNHHTVGPTDQNIVLLLKFVLAGKECLSMTETAQLISVIVLSALDSRFIDSAFNFSYPVEALIMRQPTDVWTDQVVEQFCQRLLFTEEQVCLRDHLVVSRVLLPKSSPTTNRLSLCLAYALISRELAGEPAWHALVNMELVLSLLQSTFRNVLSMDLGRAYLLFQLVDDMVLRMHEWTSKQLRHLMEIYEKIMYNLSLGRPVETVEGSVLLELLKRTVCNWNCRIYNTGEC